MNNLRKDNEKLVELLNGASIDFDKTGTILTPTQLLS